MLVLLTLLGCQEPFGADRHDLTSDRVAAVQVDRDGTTLRPRLALVQDGRPYSDALPPLGWSFVPEGNDEAALQVGFGEAGEGPAPELVLGDDRRLVLIVAWPDGERRHVVDIGDRALPAIDPIQWSEVVSAAVEPGLDVATDTRDGWDTAAVGAVSVDRFARLRAPSNAIVRWMATSGEFLELSEDEADWFPGAMVVDDGEVEEASAGAVGVATVVAMAVDAGTRFTVADLPVGEPIQGLVTPSGRLIPTDVAVDPGLVQGVLRADDAAPSGLRLEVLGPVDATVDPGTASLCAVPHAGPFDPNWLLEGTCLRSEVVDATVVVEAR